MCPQLHFLRQREQKKMVPGIWSASREKPGGTSAFHSSELLSCSPMAKPLLSPKPATAIRFLKPRSESKEISKSPQTVLQCEYQMVSLKSFEEPSHIPREWCSLITVPEMKGLGGLIRQLENKLYYVRLKELKLFSLSERRQRGGLIMASCLHIEKRSNSRVFLSLLTKTWQDLLQRLRQIRPWSKS